MSELDLSPLLYPELFTDQERALTQERLEQSPEALEELARLLRAREHLEELGQRHAAELAASAPLSEAQRRVIFEEARRAARERATQGPARSPLYTFFVSPQLAWLGALSLAVISLWQFQQQEMSELKLAPVQVEPLPTAGPVAQVTQGRGPHSPQAPPATPPAQSSAEHLGSADTDEPKYNRKTTLSPLTEELEEDQARSSKLFEAEPSSPARVQRAKLRSRRSRAAKKSTSRARLKTKGAKTSKRAQRPRSKVRTQQAPSTTQVDGVKLDFSDGIDKSRGGAAHGPASQSTSAEEESSEVPIELSKAPAPSESSVAFAPPPPPPLPPPSATSRVANSFPDAEKTEVREEALAQAPVPWEAARSARAKGQAREALSLLERWLNANMSHPRAREAAELGARWSSELKDQQSRRRFIAYDRALRGGSSPSKSSAKPKRRRANDPLSDTLPAPAPTQNLQGF